MGKMTLKLYVILFLGLFSMGAKCQEVALKSNLLYDAFATLNAGVEVGLADRWTLDVSANYNGWTFSHDRNGNTGFCNPRHATGSATGGLVILWVRMSLVDNTMWEIWIITFLFSEPTSQESPITAIRVGSEGSDWYMVIRGYLINTGIWKLCLVSGGFIPATMSILVLIVAQKWLKTNRITT